VYLPKRLNALAPNDPRYDAAGTPANDVNRAVPEERAPAAPHTTLAPKKIFESGLGEQQKLKQARPAVQELSTHKKLFPKMGTLLVISVIDSVRASKAVGAKKLIIKSVCK
jgi:hypothetical protein